MYPDDTEQKLSAISDFAFGHVGTAMVELGATEERHEYADLDFDPQYSSNPDAWKQSVRNTITALQERGQ